MAKMRDLYLYHCLKQIDDENPINLDSFNSRLEFQKKVYLLQALGVNLQFSFGSYLRGPYSPELTRVGFELVEAPLDEMKIDLEKDAPIKPEDVEKIEKLKEVVGSLPKDKEYWLELIGSLHFLKNQAYPPVSDWDNAKKRLEIWKPNKFSEGDKDKVIKIIKDNF